MSHNGKREATRRAQSSELYDIDCALCGEQIWSGRLDSNLSQDALAAIRETHARKAHPDMARLQ